MCVIIWYVIPDRSSVSCVSKLADSEMGDLTRSENKVMRLAAYRTIWQYCGLALHRKVR